MKILNSIAAIALIVLSLPVIVFTWLFIAFRGTRPFFTRHESSSLPGAGHLRFNVEDGHRISCYIRNFSFDLESVFFDVVCGRLSVVEGLRWMNDVGKQRYASRPARSMPEIVRLTLLLVLAAVVLWVAYFNPF